MRNCCTGQMNENASLVSAPSNLPPNILRSLKTSKGIHIDLSEHEDSGYLSLKLFQIDRPLILSEVLPFIENMGLCVSHMEGPCKAENIYVHEFVCRQARPSIAPFDKIKGLFEEAFTKICQEEIENDVFNALILRAGLPWREVTILRTFARYLKQLRFIYAQDMIAATLMAHPETTRKIVNLFLTRHDPDLRGGRNKIYTKQIKDILDALNDIRVIEEDRTLRRFLNLVQASLRTNYFQHGKEYLAIKFDSRALEFIPLPKPLVEIFVASPRVEGIHLRGGKVARGGIRWSDRRNDFRNEILGLMKAQMVKNSVIVPVGSKGGFIVKKPPKESDKIQAEGIACYSLFISGLLDLTDNRVGNKIVTPPRVVRHDGDDPYLVVAADKGTATFSDIANGISQEYGFWLGDAFASGGSAGFDHKKMGITARGAWESIKRHFREIGKDIQTTDFTCIGVGDMSGDVFGNGMLLSKHTCLIGAFDHRHIFCDPNPDPLRSFAERQRLFKLPRSSWNSYDRKKISKGGGVFPRTEKTIKISSEMKKAYGITADALAPNELIQALLRAKVDLLYFGGIGTYVKASEESCEDVRDRINDALRVNGKDLQASVVGEGANLAFTQRGRIEYARKGGHLNTDAIDNSAGVATSDHEVNIKILLNKIVSRKALSIKSRNKLLDNMKDDIARQVLRDNYLQPQSITLETLRAHEILPFQIDMMRTLEKSGLLNRAVEFLPDEAEIAERQHLGRNLTRPELAILLSYTKIWLYDQILASDLPDDPYLNDELMRYFPPTLRNKYTRDISQHQLRREIIATGITNDLVNHAGASYLFAMMQRTDRSVADIVRAYILVRETFELPALWDEIEKLDNRVEASAQSCMLLEINRLVRYATRRFLAHFDDFSSLSPIVPLYRDGATRLKNWLQKCPSEVDEVCRIANRDLTDKGVSSSLARRIAMATYAMYAPDITQLVKHCKCGIEKVAETFFGLDQRLSLNWLRKRALTLGKTDHWQREAVVILLDDIFSTHRKLVTKMLAGKKPSANESSVWATKNAERLAAYDGFLNEIRALDNLDVAMLTLASRHLRALVM